MKKHGIYIEKHRKTQTKKIYNEDYLLVRYLYQPHQTSFKNKMVNDINQHFCGAWSIRGLALTDDALLARVLAGDKPMAVLSEKSKARFCKYYKKINQLCFDSAIVYNSQSQFYHFLIAVKGKMKDLFDLPTLQKDYEDCGIKISISAASEKSLKDYFSDWDAGDIGSETALWETGLILGYPIENTISLYKNGVR